MKLNTPELLVSASSRDHRPIPAYPNLLIPAAELENTVAMAHPRHEFPRYPIEEGVFE